MAFQGRGVGLVLTRLCERSQTEEAPHVRVALIDKAGSLLCRRKIQWECFGGDGLAFEFGLALFWGGDRIAQRRPKARWGLSIPVACREKLRSRIHSFVGEKRCSCRYSSALRRIGQSL